MVAAVVVTDLVQAIVVDLVVVAQRGTGHPSDAQGGSGNAGGYSPPEGNDGGDTSYTGNGYGGGGGGGAGGAGGKPGTMVFLVVVELVFAFLQYSEIQITL